MEQIHTDAVAPSTAPLSQAIETNDLLFVSGQVHRAPEGELLQGDIETQSRQVLENVAAILEEAGASFDDVVKATVFLTDADDFEAFNRVYEEYITEPYPARSLFAVEALALEELDVEMEVIAEV